MSLGLSGIASIWLHLLLPSHWPILLAGLSTLIYRRKLRGRGKFFLVSWVLGYGMQGLLSVPWPLVWMMFFDKHGERQEFAVLYLYAQSLVSVLLTLWAVHVIATRYWHRLYP